MCNIQYDVKEWRIFIDSSKTNLKAGLLHNGSKYASVPLELSAYLKECYGKLASILTELKYKDSGWTVCSDLKVISMVLGQQAGYTKYPCFLCEWDNLDKKNHWIKKKRLHRKTLKPGNKNVVEESLVEPSKVLLPPLHINLGLLKQFVKAL
ncbi:hypothetical protein AVEN_108940-1 [Araneus ventricosus]|uniref:Uncharacterized protein n=1 Tax=Araneus ventricosus TaxID=182803 RepID=A0A4Y2QJY7_ARAVE|nr:hypothetical protein AVEN_108940-1 [Araneus ventricosus]